MESDRGTILQCVRFYELPACSEKLKIKKKKDNLVTAEGVNKIRCHLGSTNTFRISNSTLQSQKKQRHSEYHKVK